MGSIVSIYTCNAELSLRYQARVLQLNKWPALVELSHFCFLWHWILYDMYIKSLLSFKKCIKHGPFDVYGFYKCITISRLIKSLVFNVYHILSVSMPQINFSLEISHKSATSQIKSQTSSQWELCNGSLFLCIQNNFKRRETTMACSGKP